MASASAAPTAHLSSDPASKDRWVCIYPAYLNSRKTVAEGRRIAKEKAVHEPTVQEIYNVCTNKGLTCAVEETKRYTRDWTMDPAKLGRIRVQLKKSDGTPCHAELQTRKQILLYLGDMIPRLKSRHTHGASAAAAGGAAASAGVDPATAAASSSGGSSGGGKSNKGGKKKKK
eukprot:scpid29268/ scgid15408/ Signal recognition particle 19 kDa protein; Signal recognition particle 19 kDa protein